MFNNNKNNNNTVPMNANNSDKNLPSVNMISEGTSLKGTIETKNDIRIAGKLDGEAVAKGKIIVSSTGKIDGDLEAVDADIAGRVDGEVKVTNKLILRKSAIVEGDIYTKTILAEEGAQINGSFHMNENIQNEIKSSNGLTGKFGSKNKPKEDLAGKEDKKG